MTPKVWEPKTFKQAEASPEAGKWSAAWKGEMDSIFAQKVLLPCKLPEGRKALPTMLLYKLKDDGRFKARLVTLGCRQQYGTDFFEVYAPASKHSTLRAVLAVAAQRGLLIHQLDVKTAFLNAPLEEDIYVTLPPEVQGGGGGVTYKLQKALYGLKQAPRAWYKLFSGELVSMGFRVSEADPALFIRSGKYQDTYVLIHVDDALIVDAALDVISSVKAAIGKRFKITDMGEISTYVGMEVQRDWRSGTLDLTQRRYTDEVLERFGFVSGGKPTGTPIDPCMKMSAAIGSKLNSREAEEYMAVVGSLMYLAVCTRPDISQAVGVLARFMSAPTDSHMVAAKSVLRYVASTRDMGIRYGGAQQEISGAVAGYTDSDFAGNLDNRRSTTGYAFMLNMGVIAWASHLQHTTATSTTEAEYQAAAAGTKEALWLRKLLPDLGEKVGTIAMWGDNQAALKLLSNHMTSEQSKHIDVMHHFVRERVANKEVKFSYVPTAENIADVLTKALAPARVAACIKGMGLVRVMPKT